ncbi:MAG: BMP family ABC transporter substrate-binding protein [Bacilli bacterium]|nr:BMP family ABC transporter substrate-binding protein [Bacilli bacterium]
MKKQLFLMSALALTTFAAVTSCGNGYSGEKLKIGLICLHDKSSTYDNNFIEGFNAAVEASKAKGYTDNDHVSIKTNIDDTGEAGTKAAEEFAEDEYNLVLTDSFGHDAQVDKIVKKYPNVQFSCATGTLAYKEKLSNFHNAFASIYEGRYLVGIAAGQYLLEHGHKDTNEAICVGYVGAMPYAEVISGYTSWYLGVKSIFPNVTMKVSYTNSWYDIEGEQAAAIDLIDNGKCILISQHADSVGAPKACKDKKIPNVSYNTNTVTQFGPEYNDTFVGYSRIDWQPYYERIIESVATKKAIDGEKDYNWLGTLSTGSVKYEVNSDLVKDKSKITDAEKKLREGTLKVFDVNTFTVKNADGQGGHEKGKTYDCDGNGKLTKFMGDILDEGDYARDTDLVDGGDYVKESYYRSAPAFDLIIDGIDINWKK